MTPKHHLITASLIFLLAAACAPSPPRTASPPGEAEDRPQETASRPGDPQPGEGSDPPASNADRRKLRQKLAERGSRKAEILERGASQDEDAVTGEVPRELLAALLADLAESQEADPDTIEVLQAQAVVWNDGSMGCAEPGQAYLQVLVPGYRVILGHKGQRFDYRASDKGSFRLCESPSLAAPGAGREPPVD